MSAFARSGQIGRHRVTSALCQKGQMQCSNSDLRDHLVGTSQHFNHLVGVNCYSGLIPAAATTSGQRCNSLLIKASNCSGVPPTMSAACVSVMTERTAGTCKT